MSSIDIRHDHSLTPTQARAAIDEAARKLTDRYGIASHWEGDTLRIARAGVDGAIALLPQQVRVTAELGFLLSAMQPMVESEIRRLLAEKTGLTAPVAQRCFSAKSPALALTGRC